MATTTKPHARYCGSGDDEDDEHDVGEGDGDQYHAYDHECCEQDGYCHDDSRMIRLMVLLH